MRGGQDDRTYLPTSTQKSPRIVPGMASPGSVAPMRAREARTTSSPCHTCRGYRQRDESSQGFCPPGAGHRKLTMATTGPELMYLTSRL